MLEDTQTPKCEFNFEFFPKASSSAASLFALFGLFRHVDALEASSSAVSFFSLLALFHRVAVLEGVRTE